jgi:hypothetical protein
VRISGNLNRAAKIPEGLPQDSKKESQQPQADTSQETEQLTYNYDDKNITIAGTLIKMQSDGASFYALQSDQPFNIDGSKVSTVQVAGSIDKDLLDRYLNQKVELTGYFYPAHTQYHHLSVLFDAQSITSISGTAEATKDNALTGFYTRYDKMSWDAPVTCDALTVVDGDQRMIAEFKANVQQGNTLNYIDNQGRLVINLDLDSVDAQTREKIIRSTPGSPVEIGVLKPSLPPTDVHACFSLIQVLWAK